VVTYIIRRVAILIPTLFVITIISYFIMRLCPGDPVATMYFDPTIDQSEIAVVREKLGLDDPIYIQYFRWLTRFFRGNMGRSVAYNLPVWKLLKVRIGPTAVLMGLSLLVAYLFAIPIGTISAIKKYTPLDYGITTLAFFGVSMPNFWLGLLLIWIFAVYFKILPSYGMYSLRGGGGILDLGKHLILPVFVLGTAYMASITRYMRAQVLEVLNEDYIQTARSKGLAERVVIFKHMMRNSLIPIVTLFGLQLPALFGGALITEQIFSWPGMGFFYFKAINSRDYPTLMAILTITAVLTLLGNFFADLAYGVIDPRIRYN
jgi:peptide/nickel transport system permease protein